MKPHLALACLLCVGSTSSPSASAISIKQETETVQYQVPARRVIFVDGAASIQTTPDKATVTLAVKNWDKSVRLAYDQNEDACKKVLAALSSLGISPQYIQTSEISVEPRYPSGQSYSSTPTSREPDGYEVEKTIYVAVRDLKSLPGLLTRALEAGATHISSVHFDSSNLRKYRDQARILALRAAREKAEALAVELNAHIGKALAVSESGSDVQDLSSSGRYSFFPNLTNNISRADSFAGETYGTVAPGQLMVSSSLNVTFELTE